MTLEELKANYTVAYKIIMRERAMRDKVFAANQEKRTEKIGEMDKLLEIIDDMKDELKKSMNEPEQATLLEVVQRGTYQ